MAIKRMASSFGPPGRPPGPMVPEEADALSDVDFGIKVYLKVNKNALFNTSSK